MKPNPASRHRPAALAVMLPPHHPAPRHSWRGFVLSGLFLALMAVMPQAHALDEPLYILTDAGQIVTATQNTTAALGTPVTITGITAGETLVSIDVRPQNEGLYGLGVNAMANNATLYFISPQSGVARVVGSAGSIAYTTDGTTPVDLPDPVTVGYDMDFNPAVDRLRVVAGSLNLRINPNNGTPVDGAPGTTGINPDGSINGNTITVDATAYTNNQPNNGGITTQYTLDAATDTLFIQNPPNNGTQVQVSQLTLNASPIDIQRVHGFDIAPGVNAATGNAAVAAGIGYTILSSAGVSRLYQVDLTNGILTEVGQLSARAFAIQLRSTPAIALSSDGTSVVRTSLTAPGTSTNVAVTGVTAGESLVALDMRAATGQIYALGINASADNGTLYLLDPQLGSVTVIGSPSSVAYVDATSNAVDFPDPTVAGWDIDFNPLVDAVRVVTSSGLNFRINVTTGAPVDGNAGITGINTDGAINSGTTTVDATAYTNSFSGTAFTTQYTLDAASNSLYIQNPPNNGTQVLVQAITSGGNPLDFSGPVGFDIIRTVTTAASGTAVPAGFGFFSANVSGTTNLYRLNLVSGEATLLGATALNVRSLSVYFAQEAPAVVTPTVASLAHDSVTLGGTVADDNGAAILERGVVYAVTSVNAQPEVGGTGVTLAAASGTTGVFTASVTGLTTGTSYTFRAFARNSQGTTYTAATQFTPPNVQDPVFADASVSEVYTLVLQSAPGVKLSVTGLPPGLKFNATTGTISGRITAPGVYQIVITAKGPGALTTTLVKTLSVQALPKTAVGTFIGLIGANASINNNASGRVDLTVTGTGAATLKVTQSNRTTTVKGNLTASAGGTPTFAANLPNNVAINLSLNADNSLTGTLSQPPNMVNITGWRRTNDKVLNPSAAEAGYYTVGLILNPMMGSNPVPEGHGFASVTVGSDGITKIAGRAADGNVVASAGFLGPNGETLFFAPLYNKIGSIAGELTLTLDPSGAFVENTIDGNLAWTKPDTGGRLYPDDFVLEEINVFGKYLARAAKGSIVLGLPSSTSPSTLSFTQGGISSAALNPNLNDLVNFTIPGFKATVPAPGSPQNQARTSISITAANGNVSGSFTLVDSGVRRVVSYKAMIVRSQTGSTTAVGYFLLPQLPIGPSSAILSGQVELRP